MKVLSMMLVRNEADRWLRPALAQLQFLSDRIVVVDDASTDDTVAICREYTDEVHETAKSIFRSAENVQRARLWDLATKGAKNGDWVLIFDADELMPEGDLESFKHLLTTKALSGVDSLGLRIFDMWDENRYRDDQYWTAHHRTWVKAVRFNTAHRLDLPDKAQHCGGFPSQSIGRIGATELRIMHMGWSRPEDRARKHEAYLAADPNGEFGWLEQYHSILDPSPNLVAVG